MILEYQPSFLGPCALQGSILWDLTDYVLVEAKVCSPEVQGNELAACSLSWGPQTLPSHGYCSQGCLEALNSLSAAPCSEQKFQHGTFSCWLLNYLYKEYYKEVVIDTFDEPWRLLMLCHVVPLTDIPMAEIPNEDQVLQV